jgi:hypothetical protein
MMKDATAWIDGMAASVRESWVEGLRWRVKDLRTPPGARLVAKCPGCKHKDPAENVSLP